MTDSSTLLAPAPSESNEGKVVQTSDGCGSSSCTRERPVACHAPKQPDNATIRFGSRLKLLLARGWMLELSADQGSTMLSLSLSGAPVLDRMDPSIPHQRTHCENSQGGELLDIMPNNTSSAAAHAAVMVLLMATVMMTHHQHHHAHRHKQ